jgi:hypothetical protein
MEVDGEADSISLESEEICCTLVEKREWMIERQT